MHDADAIRAAAAQAWPAFALVTGLLLVGVVAERDGLFAAAGARLSRLPLGPRTLLVAALALVALVTAVLNLDTSVFFLTPVLLHLARHRGIDESPFLYGTVFMSNAASLFLPGSNLTNLIVLHHERVAGATFLARMWPAAAASVATTTLIVVVAFWRTLGAATTGGRETVRAHLGLGVAGVAASTILVLALASPALPVLIVGVVVVLLARTDPCPRVRNAPTRACSSACSCWPSPSARSAAGGMARSTSSIRSIAGRPPRPARWLRSV